MTYNKNNIKTHGDTRKGKITREYAAYASAKSRCSNPNCSRYKNYGGRGIEFRFNSYEGFLAEVGRKPTPKHSLNRIDNNGHYEKGNLEWTTPAQQARNRRNNTLLTIDGASKVLSEWLELSPIRAPAVSKRIHLGWCPKCALTIPVHTGTCIHK